MTCLLLRPLTTHQVLENSSIIGLGENSYKTLLFLEHTHKGSDLQIIQLNDSPMTF